MKLSKNVINQIKKYPVKLLQNIEKEKVEFIYYVDEIDKLINQTNHAKRYV